MEFVKLHILIPDKVNFGRKGVAWDALHIGVSMHDFEVTKSACMQAMDGNESSRALFHRVVNPEVALELVGLVEDRITPHELETLTILVRNLTNYLEATRVEEKNNMLPDRDDLIRQAKYALSIYAR